MGDINNLIKSPGGWNGAPSAQEIQNAIIEAQGTTQTTGSDYWVDGDNGDDATADGSPNSPFLTIQAAIDYAYTDVGPWVLKNIHIKDKDPADPFYEEQIFIRHRKYRFVGHSNNGLGRVVIGSNNVTSFVPLVITEMTKDTFDAFMLAGGPTHTATDTAYTYTGQPLAIAEYTLENHKRFDGDSLTFPSAIMDLTFENLEFKSGTNFGSDKLNVLILGNRHGLTGDTAAIQNINFVNCYIVGHAGPSLFAKNASTVLFAGCNFGNNTQLIWDNCRFLAFKAGASKKFLADVHLHETEIYMRNEVPASAANEGDLWLPTGYGLLGTSNDVLFKKFVMYSGAGRTITRDDGSGDVIEFLDLHTFGDIFVNGAESIGVSGGTKWKSVRALNGNITLNDTSSLHTNDVFCEDFTKNSTGTMEVESAQIKGNAIIDNGGTLRNAFIGGNLTVNVGTVTLENVVVMGTITVDAGATVNHTMGFRGGTAGTGTYTPTGVNS